MNYRQLKGIKENLRLKMEMKDLLTGAYKEEYFLQYVNNKFNGSIIKIKIDGINFININYGSEKGDSLLRLIARRLNYSYDNIVLARLSKFTFHLYTPTTNSQIIRDSIESMLDTIIDEIVGRYKIHVQCNVAAVIYDDGDLNIEDAISKLEVCMSRLSKKGNGFEIYNENHENYISVKAIERAIEKNEIKLYYQPKINLESGKITGVEALVRWFSKEHGYITPDKLISFSEEYGYINVLGKWILERACKDIKYLNSTLNTSIDVAVNISPSQLEHGNFTQDLFNCIEELKFKPTLLKLEITESENIEDIIIINEIIDDIKRKGIKIAIDDFGKGFNSINYIKNYNVDEIKIDKTLVEYMNDNPVFIESLIKMIHSTKTKVVAEGVETEFEYNKLKSIECDLVQGYYCHKPMNIYKLIDIIGREKYIINKKLGAI